MPTYNQERNIKGYWEEVKDQYPNMDFDTFEKICKAPFEFIKKCIRDDRLPFIAIKYFGKIRPKYNLISNMIRCFKDKTEELYVNKRNFLIKYREEMKHYDEKYKNATDREIEVD